ncbi:MAG TPA: ABC transporter ATP-binding protein [Polyangiales bacterium]|nr:ABC transporter ATP-binding protein [Polyangiales bacterium]
MTEPVISARGLVRDYGEVHAVRGIDLEIVPGELYGLVGPDGAGKSTTISCLAGLLAPTRGEVRILGENPLSRRSRAREQLGLMPQQYSLYGDLSIAENLSFFGRLFGLSSPTFRQRSERLLGITRLTRFVDRRADALSGGMYKKLALACALLHQPRVLLMDEPTNGVDPVSRRELWELIYELLADGMAVLVSTPYMDEAARCHRVGLLHEGQIIAEGVPSALSDQLEYEVLELSGGERERLHALLVDSPLVVAASPAGRRMRVVVAPGGQAELSRLIASAGASAARVAPSFEDLFLARVAAHKTKEAA